MPGNGRVHVFDRKTLQEVGGFGRIGRYAGQFVFMHNLATDSRGNLYVSEVGNGRRVQKFVLAGPLRRRRLSDARAGVQPRPA